MAITSARKRTPELDITRNETFSGGVDCVQIISVVANIRDVSDSVEELDGKGKVEKRVVKNGDVPKVKRRYVKKNIEYWDKKQLVSLDRKRKVTI